MLSDLDSAATLRVFTRRVRDTATGFSLRLSARFMHPKFKLLSEQHLSDDQTVPLKSFCARPICRGVQPEYDEGEILVAKTGTLKNGYLDWSDAQSVSEEFYNATKFRAGLVKGDILISSTGVGSLGKIDYFDGSRQAMADGHISVFRAASSGDYDSELLVYLLRSRVVQWQIEQGLTGATNQIDIYPPQLEQLRIPKLASSVRDKLLPQIRGIEKEISQARAQLRNNADVIDEILAQEFHYPLKDHKETARRHQYVGRLSAAAVGFELRNSAKFHHPDFNITKDFFAKTPHSKIKSFITVPIRLGATIKKTDFVEGGAAYYVHPGATKSQEVIRLEDCYQVSQEFYEDTARRFGLVKGDLVLNRAGEGTIGKSGLWDSDEPAIASDFTMRIRFNDEINRRFAWFFLQSVMFQAQVAREKRGMGNMTNIFPPEVERMLIVDCHRDRQDEIARAITKELAKLAAHRESIETKRQEVVALIEAAIHKPAV